MTVQPDHYVGIAGAVDLSAFGHLSVSQVDFARPANTDQYAARDVVGPPGASALLTFRNVAREAGGSGYIVKARLLTSRNTDVERMRLHLFHTAPEAKADNAAYSLLYANRALRLGAIDFPSLSTEAGSSDSSNALTADLRFAFSCAAGTRDLFGFLETIDVFTPASGQGFFVELTAETN